MKRHAPKPRGQEKTGNKESGISWRLDGGGKNEIVFGEQACVCVCVNIDLTAECFKGVCIIYVHVCICACMGEHAFVFVSASGITPNLLLIVAQSG